MSKSVDLPALYRRLGLLIEALQTQSQAINRLAASNEQMAEALVQVVDEGDETSTTYMDGSPLDR